jgi:hypothetical protein
MPDWAVLLGLVWSLIFIIADIQHGNTNTFVLGALVASLWLYRKGRDGWAGAALALAICLKMIPAIFLLYWLYQRGWKVLASTVIWLVIMLVVLPAAAMAVREMADPATADTETSLHQTAATAKQAEADKETERQGDKETKGEENAQTQRGRHAIDNPQSAIHNPQWVERAKLGLVHYRELMETWYQNLIKPGLVKAAPYPVHINQSLPATLCRYFLKGVPDGDIFWNPDDYPNYADHLAAPGHQAGWIAVASLDESTVKTIFRICQVAILALMAWAIGWRKLPRDDGRRGLHYGMVIAAMLMLNQRTWDEHSGAMLLAAMAAWYAIAFGRVGKRPRAVALVLMLAAGPLLWMCGTETFKVAAGLREFFADPRPLGMGLVFACCIILARALKNQPQPYADTRQKLGQ